METWDAGGFRFPNRDEQMQEDIRLLNAANSVIIAFETKHPEAVQQVFRKPEARSSDIAEQLHGTEYVTDPNAEMYWIAREHIARRNETSHLFLGEELTDPRPSSEQDQT